MLSRRLHRHIHSSSTTTTVRETAMKAIEVLILCTLQVNSERWYSATTAADEPREETVTNYKHERDYLPIFRSDWKPSTFPDSVETKVKKIRKKCSKSPRAKHGRGNKTRTRFLEVFEVVEFEHVSCESSSGLEGSCLHDVECLAQGGTGVGSCADGYGTCCVHILSCDTQSSAAMGWLINPGFPLPSTERISCAMTLTKYSDEVTQIRLDFNKFEFLPPTDGDCQLDQFVVSGQNTNSVVPILCGINTGQHAYVEVGNTEGPIYFTILTETAENRQFAIKVTQLTSSDELIAPPGCLQYFTQPDGDLESFNYRDESEIAITRSPSYLNNLNYAMCILRSPDTCSVTYAAGHLQILNYDTDGLPILPPGQAGAEIFNCTGDWLLIAAVRLCGERLNDGSVIQDFSLNAPVTDSSAGPVVLWFRSDEGYVGRGFRLHYEQKPCAGPD